MRGAFIVIEKMLKILILLTSLTGVCPRRTRETNVKAGDMVALYCPHDRGVCPRRIRETNVNAGDMVALYCPPDRSSNHGDAKVIWTSYSTQEMDLTDMSSAEQTQMGLLVHGRSLVILSTSINHQGNYSCSLGKASRQFWFRLTVCTTQSKDYEKRTQYPQICYEQEACRLYCPEVNVPAVNTLNITSNGIIWHKEGESLPKDYFAEVKQHDSGDYTCTRSYLYHRQVYNMTFTVVLGIRRKVKEKVRLIWSPNNDHVFYVNLGATVVIDCKAEVYSDFDELFWLDGKSDVEMNDIFPVFYNSTRENTAAGTNITASLVFKKVSEEDLSKNYTCRLDSLSGPSSCVNITLAQKASPSSRSLALGIAAILVVIVVTVVVSVKRKMDITLFLRGTFCCSRSTSDGKSYDAFLMCYKSDTDAGLNEDDRRCLESVLEETFGYNLCLYDRDVLPGKAAAEAVLDCIEQSRTVVLVPTSPDPGPGSGLLSAIHAALVERQTRLVFIQTETTEASRSGSLPEALQLLGEAGDCVTWKGMSSMPHSSSFWKQLRYHLLAPQQASKMKLLPSIV